MVLSTLAIYWKERVVYCPERFASAYFQDRFIVIFCRKQLVLSFCVEVFIGNCFFYNLLCRKGYCYLLPKEVYYCLLSIEGSIYLLLESRTTFSLSIIGFDNLDF